MHQNPAPTETTPPAAAVGATLPNRPDAELRRLALDIADNQVFGSWNIRNPERELTMVFMALLFVKAEDMPTDIGAIYEYYKDAGPVGFNGYPIFHSCRLLNMHDTDVVQKYVDEILETKRKFLKKDGEDKSQDGIVGSAEPSAEREELGSREMASGDGGATLAGDHASSHDPTSDRLRSLFKHASASCGNAVPVRPRVESS